MAAPHVSGAWGVLKQFRPLASVDDILVVLEHTGVPVFEPIGEITKPRIQVDQALLVLGDTLFANDDDV